MTNNDWSQPAAIGQRVRIVDRSDRPRQVGMTGTVAAYDLQSCCPYVIDLGAEGRYHFNDLEFVVL